MGTNAGPKFTIVQLLVVVAMVVLFVGWLLPFGHGRREPAYKIKCASNLRQIALAIKMYANNERDGAFPRTRHDPATADRPTAYTKPGATNPFADDGPAPNDVTAAIFLILRTQEITTDVFVCPDVSVTAERVMIPDGKTIQSFSNFRSQNELSYSFQNPYPTDAAVKAGFVWNDNMSADVAIAADINPGVPALTTVKFTDDGRAQRSINSPNHNYDGQNVLYADAHVEWSASPWAGREQDNIYTFAPAAFGPPTPATTRAVPPPASAGVVGPPAGEYDSVLLPAWDAKVPLP